MTSRYKSKSCRKGKNKLEKKKGSEIQNRILSISFENGEYPFSVK
jgi:hypothetical protein